MTCCSTLCKGKDFKYDLRFTTNILTQLEPTLYKGMEVGVSLILPKSVCVRGYVRACVCVGEERGYLY